MKYFPLLLLSLLALNCGQIAKEVENQKLEEIAAKYNNGDIDGSITAFSEFVEEYPDNDLAWTILGHAYKDKDQYEEATHAYQQALVANPNCFQALTGMGIIHRMNGDYDKAMEAYTKSVEIDPSYAQAYSSMTTISLKRSEDAQALEYAKKGYELDNQDPVIAANLAVAYHYNELFTERDEMVKVAAGLGYDNVESLNNIFSGEWTVRDE